MLEATRNLPDGVVILDDDNRIVWLNLAAERLLGCRKPRYRAVRPVSAAQFAFSEWLQSERLRGDAEPRIAGQIRDQPRHAA
jgi:PAS domain-containing protein